nr:uncharacterized protein LOC112011079 [Quercus suber]
MDKVLFAYLAVAPHVVSLVLIRVDSDIQRLVYYVSKSLHEAKIHYLPLEKAILAVVHTTLYVDGVANQKRSRVRLVLISSKKITIEKSLRLGFSATNNEVEYEALLMGMAMVQTMGKKALEMLLDSRLVVGQVKGEFEAKDGRMQGYLSQVRHLQSGFEYFNLLHIPKSGKIHTNSLATLATSSVHRLPRVILVEDLYKPTEVKREVIHVHQVKVGPSWMDPMVLFLKEDILLEKKSETDKV